MWVYEDGSVHLLSSSDWGCTRNAKYSSSKYCLTSRCPVERHNNYVATFLFRDVKRAHNILLCPSRNSLDHTLTQFAIKTGEVT